MRRKGRGAAVRPPDGLLTLEEEPPNEEPPLMEVGSKTITELASEFAPLRLRIQMLLDTQIQVWPGDEWTEAHEHAWSQLIDPIRDRMVIIRDAIVAKQANTPAELQIKATVLLDLLEEDTTDIVSQLTRSICHDLLSFNETPPGDDQARR